MSNARPMGILFCDLKARLMVGVFCHFGFVCASHCRWMYWVIWFCVLGGVAAVVKIVPLGFTLMIPLNCLLNEKSFLLVLWFSM